MSLSYLSILPFLSQLDRAITDNNPWALVGMTELEQLRMLRVTYAERCGHVWMAAAFVARSPRLQLRTTASKIDTPCHAII